MSRPATRPTGVAFNCAAVTDDFRAFVRRLLALISDAGLPAITDWQNATVGNGRPGQLEAAIEALPRTARESPDGPVFLQFGTAEGFFGSAKFHPQWSDRALATANLQWILRSGDDLATLVEFQRRCVDVCRDLLLEFHLHSADLRPIGGGAVCVPDVPLVDMNSHVVVINESEVNQAYDAPEAFWKAGWSEVAKSDGQHLLARDLDVVAGPEYLSRIIDCQWAMARAAKPGETGYRSPDVLPEEEPIFRAGEKTLHFVGYAPAGRLAEYSCALTRGRHVLGWEVYALLNIVEGKAMPDGSPVETVRIVFLDEGAARQEKRPLLEVGCRVFHFDAKGEQRELTE